MVGAVVGVAVDAHDHVWITHRPSTLQPNETRSFWQAAPPVLEFDQRRHAGVVVGRARRRLRVAAARARHLRRPPGQRLARRRRRQGRADPEVHAPGQVPAADRPSGPGHAAATTRRTSARAAQHGRRSRAPTSSTSPTATSTTASSCSTPTTGAYKRHWGAYGKKPDDCVLHERRRAAARARSAARCRTRTSRASTIRTVRRRRSSASSTPCGSRTTASSTSAIARTIASRCSGRTARSCRRRSSRRRRSAADRCGTSASRPIRQQTFLIVTDGTNQQVYVAAARRRCEVVQHLRRRRPLGRPVLRRAQPRGRLEGQPLHHRNLRGQARAEVRVPRVARALRRTRALAGTVAGLLIAVSAVAQFGGPRGPFHERPNVPYDGRFTFVRAEIHDGARRLLVRRLARVGPRLPDCPSRT